MMHIRIAIGADSLVARGAIGELTLPLSGDPSQDGRWPELDIALAELRSKLPHRAKVSASIALLPPLVQLRRISLPPLKPEDRRRVLCRDASRWFVGAREPFVADAVLVPDANGEVMAAAITIRHADAIARAASGARIDLTTMQAAPWAWAASLDRAQRGSSLALVVPTERSIIVVKLARGAVTGIRRLRDAEDSAERLDELLTEQDTPGAVHRIADGMTVAAEFAHRARGPELLPESSRAARQRMLNRRARALALAAAAVLVVAAGVELWGVRRQLSIVRSERALLRDHVGRAMASRDSALALEAQLGTVATEVREAPRWTAVIAALTQRLPDDAWLQSLSASGDSVTLVGEAVHAADVFEALRRDPAIAGVRADAPIRREMATDRASVERYALTVRLTRAALTTVTQEAP